MTDGGYKDTSRDNIREKILGKQQDSPDDVKIKIIETSLVDTKDFVAEYFTDGTEAWFFKQYKVGHKKAGEIERVDKVPTEDFKGIYVPYKGKDSMASCCLWGSDLTEYGSEIELFRDICTFIHKWVEIPVRFEQMCAMYVMYTYQYENFREAPYLRVIGDLGSGKTRLSVDVLGQLVYRPIRTIAASSMASIFRSLSDIKGSLVLDEADMNDKSDKTSEIVQLLNSGYKKGVAILRIGEGTGKGQKYKTEQFHVYGPKVICSREHMKDDALESRCIPIKMVELTRKDIPLFTDDTIETDGQELRNKLYKWRYDKRGTDFYSQIDQHFLGLKMSSRVKQLFMILSSVIVDPELKSILYDYGEQVHAENTSRRGESAQGAVLEALRELVVTKIKDRQTLAPETEDFVFATTTLTRRVNEMRPEQDKEISSRYIGRIVRETCGFRQYRSNTIRGIAANLGELNNMFDRFGVKQIVLSEELPLTMDQALADPELKSQLEGIIF
jgi:hypothetical protein